MVLTKFVMSHKARINADRYQVKYGRISEKIFRIITEEEKQSLSVAFLRASATLAAWLYNKTVALRNLFFDHEVLKIHRLSCPIISVGNLAMGGTGKTPMVVWLARFLSQEGYRVGIVSRGYGGIESKRVTVVSDGKNILADLAISGDEPLMLARQLSGIPVLCSTKRVRAGKAAIEKFDCNVLILDDGFQHRYIARDLDVVMLDSRDPYGSDRIFPRGKMRERATALARAHVLVLSRSDVGEAAEKRSDNLRRQWPDKTIVTAIHRPIRIFSAADNTFVWRVDDEKSGGGPFGYDLSDRFGRPVDCRNTPVYFFFRRDAPCQAGGIAGSCQFRAEQVCIEHSF